MKEVWEEVHQQIANYIRGKVIEIITGEPAVQGFVDVTKKYTGSEPAQRPPAAERVVYRIEAESVVAPDA